MSTDHKLRKTAQERLWVREQISQLGEMRATIENVYQNLAVLARLAGVSPGDMVKEVRNTTVNYAFLIECMKEEQRLNAEAQQVKETASLEVETPTINQEGDQNGKEDNGNDTSGA